MVSDLEGLEIYNIYDDRPNPCFNGIWSRTKKLNGTTYLNKKS